MNTLTRCNGTQTKLKLSKHHFTKQDQFRYKYNESYATLYLRKPKVEKKRKVKLFFEHIIMMTLWVAFIPTIYYVASYSGIQ